MGSLLDCGRQDPPARPEETFQPLAHPMPRMLRIGDGDEEAP